MVISTHKIGDTFDYSDQLRMTIDGVAVTDFTGMTGSSQLRYAGSKEFGIPSGTLVVNLDFLWIDITNGLYRVRYNGSTSGWAAANVLHDVQLTTASGDVISTATELIKIVEDVTHG